MLAGFGHTVTGVKRTCKVSALKEGQSLSMKKNWRRLSPPAGDKKIFSKEKIDESIAGDEVSFIAWDPVPPERAADYDKYQAAAEIAIPQKVGNCDKSTVHWGAKRVRK